MYRKDLITILRHQPHTIAELAQLLDETPKEVEQDLQHFLRSLKRTSHRALIEPAQCKHCGFVFGDHKLRKPGKCPLCQGTWISAPRISIEE